MQCTAAKQLLFVRINIIKTTTMMDKNIIQAIKRRILSLSGYSKKTDLIKTIEYRCTSKDLSGINVRYFTDIGFRGEINERLNFFKSPSEYIVIEFVFSRDINFVKAEGINRWENSVIMVIYDQDKDRYYITNYERNYNNVNLFICGEYFYSWDEKTLECWKGYDQMTKVLKSKSKGVLKYAFLGNWEFDSQNIRKNELKKIKFKKRGQK